MWNVTVNKTGGTMTFTPGGEADGVTTILSPTSVFSASQYITQGLKIQNAGATVTFGSLQMPIPDSLQVSAGAFTAFTTWFTSGGTIPVAPGIAYQNVRASGGFVAPNFASTGDLMVDVGNLIFNGNATIGGNLTARHGQLNIDGQRVLVAGSFQTDSGGVLVMNTPGDSLNVAGDVTFAGGDTQGALNEGTLVIGGNFHQSAITSTTSFAPGGNHRTAFDRLEGSQNAFFDSPGTTNTGSHFMNLDLSSAIGGGIVLNVNTIVDGALISVGSGAILGGGATLTAHQLQVNGLTVDNASIVLIEQTVLPEQFDGVTYQNLPITGAVGLVINGAGGNRNLIFDSVNFPDLPNDGTNVYVRLVSTNQGSFVLDMQNSNQGGNLGPDLSDPPNEAVVNGAQVIWRAT
jgi:hypothetical protein